MQTRHLNLIVMQRDAILAHLAALSPEDRAQVSLKWLARVEASTSADPWTHGFSIVHRESGHAVGQCAFKGPPDDDGVVEIAYGIDPDHRGKGYATEAAEALTAFAIDSRLVRIVCAHTLKDAPASQRVLTKCGFRCIGEVIDPEDGLVLRWEKAAAKRFLAKADTSSPSAAS